MENYKVYVEVTVKFSTDGVMMPVEFIWEDGTKYLIERTLCQPESGWYRNYVYCNGRW